MLTAFAFFYFLGLLGGIIAFLVGMLSPETILRWSDPEDLSRWAVIKQIGGGTILFFFLGLVVTDLLDSSTEQRRFIDNREAITERIDSLIQAGEPRVALDSAAQYLPQTEDGSRLDSLFDAARADTLYQDVLEIPAAQVDRNRKMYKRLVELDPGNNLYREKLDHYRRLAEEKRDQPQQEVPQGWEFDATVAYEDEVDTRIKAQVEQRVFVSGSVSEEGLRRFLKNRYQQLSTRSGFTYHNGPTNIYIYVFGSENRAEQGGMGWMGAVMKGASDEAPDIEIKPNLIKSYKEGPEEKFGFSEAKRKEIFRELVRAEDRALADAEDKYPDDFDQQTDYQRELEEKYTRQVREEYGITEAIADSITTEAIYEKEWPMPEPKR